MEFIDVTSLVDSLINGTLNLSMDVQSNSSMTELFGTRFRPLSISIEATSDLDPQPLNLPLPWNFEYDPLYTIRVPKEQRTLKVLPNGQTIPSYQD